MEIKILEHKIAGSHFTGNLEIAWKEIAPFWQEAIDEIVKNAELPGFRKGKAPKSLVLEKLEEKELQKKVLALALPAILESIVLKQSFTPISAPWLKIITLEEGKDVKLKIGFDIWPQVEIKNYRNLKIKARPTKVSEEELERALLQLQRSRAQYISVDRPAKLGDFVEVEFEGSVNGIKREELSW
jgi:trigger factor